MYAFSRLQLIGIIVLLCLPVFRASSQCTGNVNTYPYIQDFESGAGGWNSGGLSDDWALGTPSKTAINTAASGVNCWITGGLTTSFYNFGERSWVKSPCFDFTNLNHPEISLHIYWETEYHYDGGNLQYTINGGTTWTNVGTTNEPVDCYTQNWYNYSNITNLNSLGSNNNGWSGNNLSTSGSCQGGNGSLGWLLAKHCLSALAHQPQVIFRITFGAGTTCNSYDGLAFDDIRIDEAPLPVVDFTFTCPSSNMIAFTDSSGGCTDSWSWNFGDGNVSTAHNPTHQYAAPGTFLVTLIGTSSCGGVDSITKQISVIGASVTSTDESCPGTGDGSAIVTVTNPGTFNYSWNTTPVQLTAAATGLSGGSYAVTISAPNTCILILPVNILTGTGLTITASSLSTPETCAGRSDGTATVQVTQPGVYSYAWNTVPPQSTQTATGLAAGTYSVSVNGAGLCHAFTYQAIVQLVDTQSVQATILTTPASCPSFNNGTATINLSSPGSFNYAWNTIPVQVSQTAVNLIPGTYTISVSGSNLCRSSLFTADILQDNAGIPVVNLGNDTSTCAGMKILLAPGPFTSYNWNDGSDSSYLVIDKPGSYWVTVTNSLGCMATDTIHFEENCIDQVEVPNSFTPNNDGMNEIFRAYGLQVQEFSMQIFDRWGEVIFSADNIYKGWDGTYKNNIVQEGIYVWLIHYSLDGKVQQEKVGSVFLFR